MNDEELDLLLRADAAAGPEDAGFTQRLMARVADAVAAPAPKPRPASNRLPQRMAQLAALSIALFGFCLLWPSVSDAWSHAQSGGESALGGAVLLCLVVWWTLPQARSNPWR